VLTRTAGTPEEQIQAFGELAQLELDVLGNRAAALDAVAALAILEPGVVAHRKLATELAGPPRRYDKLARVLIASGERAAAPELVASLFLDGARVFRDHLEAPARAIDLYGRVLALPPGDSENQLQAARELDAVLAASGRRFERCDVLERLARIE